MSNLLRVYTGLPGTGKTSRLIDEMAEYENAGGKVLLFLSSEHEELTRRPNVKPGGLMGCRAPGKNFRIDRVCTTEQAREGLGNIDSNTMAVFDEAQFFRTDIVDAWFDAAARGVNVLVASPSHDQLIRLNGSKCTRVEFEVNCACCERKASDILYEENLTYPTHLCRACYQERYKSEIDALLEDVRKEEPFPGDLHTYQPFYGVEMRKWELVRGDSQARLDIIIDAVQRSAATSALVSDPMRQPAYLDLGCCSGFFCDGMSTLDFKSTGVDITKNFISWANRLAKIKGQGINYLCADAHKYLLESNEQFDVTSTFATVQWVMAQNGYEKGVECFKSLFEKTKHVAIVEMGYTSEDIYSDKIADRPSEINKDWVLDIMKKHGDFASIEVHHAGESGIWRDIFVGFKEVPTSRPFRQPFESKVAVHVSNTMDYWEDGWVGPAFEAYFQAIEPIKLLSVKGWRPTEKNGSGKSGISVEINGEPVGEPVAEESFECSFDLMIQRSEVFKLAIRSTALESRPGDNRNLSLILKEICFS